MTHSKVVLDEDDIRRTLVRIAHEIVEKNAGRSVALVGIHRRGAHLARRAHRLVCDLLDAEIPLGDIDIAFYRDDLASRRVDPAVHSSHLPFRLEDYTVVLVDDVLYTGRTVRAAIDALFDYGRPARVQLAVLADRGHRELPIRPDYVGKNLPTARNERVNVEVAGARRLRPSDHRRAPGGAGMRHLLSIEDLDRAGIERILDRARSFTEVSEREVKKVPALRGRRVLNLFYEASTRTRSSFELAAKTPERRRHQLQRRRLGVEKGESLKDTVQTMSAYRPDLIVVRTPHVGAAKLVAGWTTAAVVNAGDGKHEHPTQALLDVYTLRERLGPLDGRRIWIVGDVMHSRVARSDILAFTKWAPT